MGKMGTYQSSMLYAKFSTKSSSVWGINLPPQELEVSSILRCWWTLTSKTDVCRPTVSRKAKAESVLHKMNDQRNSSGGSPKMLLTKFSLVLVGTYLKRILLKILKMIIKCVQYKCNCLFTEKTYFIHLHSKISNVMEYIIFSYLYQRCKADISILTSDSFQRPRK